MPDRLAIKRLTASDLTFFRSLFRKLRAGNQKAINLNADVLIGQLYPGLPGAAAAQEDTIGIALTIHGPAGSPPYSLRRGITKGDGYKNWRLNGEFIHDPEDEPGRFDVLSADDIAIFEFWGDPVPTKVSMTLLAAKSSQDAAALANIDKLIPGGRKTMAAVTRAELATAVSTVPAGHPLHLLTVDPEFEAALEDAAQGGIEGGKNLQKKTTKPVSEATLAAAKLSAEKNGRDGEALAWVVLQSYNGAEKWTSVEWSSKANAVSPYDFRVTTAAGLEIRIDAKSTNGEFSRTLHMSLAELVSAATGSRYDLWRIYSLNESGARMRIAENIADMAKSILASFKTPAGVTVDTVSIAPNLLTWGPEIAISRPDEAE